MVKKLLLLAFTASTFILVSSTGKKGGGHESYIETRSSSSSSSSSKSTSSQSISNSNTLISASGPCSHGHEYQHASTSSIASASSSSHSSTSSSSSTSSASSTSIGSVTPPIHHPDCRTCSPNERWVRCPEAVCVPQTCDDVGFPIPCYDLSRDGKCPSKPGCICEEGYVRNSEGECILMKHCPSCGGDPNAESGCGTNCNRLCSNFNKKNVSCTEDCLFNCCECKRGFVFDEVAQKCVHPSKCTPPVKCKRNEVYDLCPAPCPFRTCGINDAAVSCVQPLPTGHPDCAPPKCRCKDGFFRNNVGDCVRWEHCPKCDNPNETYDPCPAPCPPRTCDVNPALILCAVPPQVGDPTCEPGCRCIDGYVKNYTGVCIPRDQCPKCTSPNEVYDPCIAPCPPRRCDVDERVIRCAAPPKVGDPSCEAGCRCADGYKRNNKGVCIPAEECPKCTFPNEVFDPFIVPCNPRHCNVDERLFKSAPPPMVGDTLCEAGCRCADGYKRDHKGVCIPADQCPKCTQPHEVFNPCPNTCPPQTCESIGKIYHCPNKKANKDCEGQCVCEDGYFRNKIGECISKVDCMKCTGPNEYFSCGSACDNVCGLLDQQNQTNCPIVNIVCNPKCYCEEGYARDDNHICIPIKDCKAPGCGPNERYEICPPFMCQAVNCTQVGFPIACPGFSGPGCPGKSACVCKDDSVRNEKGLCIPKSQCPACGGDPNQVAGCGVYCNQRCRDVGKKPGPCILICYENACDCREGLYLDENTGKCVPPKHCTPQCPVNEVYDTCIQGNCGPKNCTQLGYPIPCPRIDPKYCKKGCVCKPGYVRNHEGTCIPSIDCPSCGGDPNAQAGCGTNCNKHCSDIGKEPGACILSCNLNGCDCKDGYYLDEPTNKCVKPEQCTPQCPANESYSDCMQGNCSPQYCDELGFPQSCPKIDPKNCKKGCLCNEGYVRNKNGVCIPSKECPKCGGDPNQVAGCGVYCNQRCRDVGKKPGPCILICYGNACDCREGLYLDENTGKCVPPKHCTPQCPVNEVYDTCIQGNCGPKNCTQLGNPIPCPRIDPKYCKKGCLCKPGYVRNHEGTCIPSIDCPSCGGDPNAQAGCGTNCNKHCSDIGKEPGACILSCNLNGCDCKDGYYLDEPTNKCVKPEQCTPQCPANESYSDCMQGNCSPQYCDELGFPQSCPKIDPKNCKKGCLCNEGYVRNKNGVCIPSKECPKCGGDPNQVAGCGVYCNQRCRDVGKKPGPCIRICYGNACDCREGLYLDENTGKCVPPKHCTPQCPVNEVYDTCIQGNCGPKNCTQLGNPISCPRIDPKYCKKGCVCKPGYVRNHEGTCIPSIDCPSCGGDPNAQAGCGTNCNKHCSDIGKEPGACILSCNLNGCDCKDGYYLDEPTNKCVKPEQCTPQCPANESYSDCMQGNCSPQYCDELGFPQSCPRIDPKYCKKGCLCNEGYVRNKNGVCIPSKDCPECGGDPNQVAGCGVYCNQRCRDVGKKPGPCILICYGNACDCREGLYLDENTGKCVPPKHCTPQCPVNEVYDTCIQGNCGPKNCTQLGNPIPCPRIDPKYCKKGCLCKPGYVRNHEGTCIPSIDCPSCGGDPNAQAGCGTNCNKHCSDIGKEPGACILSCNLNGCDCKDGYYLDEPTNKCVKPEQCTPQCPANEWYSECIQGNCSPEYCNELGFPKSCPSINPTYCKKGCLCVGGYARNQEGVCIPEKDCPSCGGDSNSQAGSGINCNKHCSDIGKEPKSCIILSGVNSCDCKEGFYYDDSTRKCVKAEQCTPQCPANESYSECIQGNCSPQYCDELGFPQSCPRIDPKYCKKGCLCNEGYVRNKNGVCIPSKDCPPTCGLNEEYNECTNANCDAKTCKDLGYPISCVDIDAVNCIKGCQCKPGHVRNHRGVCIPSIECPSCGGDPNAQTGCGGYCNRHCSDIGKEPGACILICRINGCDCKKGYYYDDNTKKCVKAENCTPTLQCNGPNEEYNKCSWDCPPQTCDSLDKVYDCPLQNSDNCKPMCRCKSGYYRNKNGQCISEEQCRSQCPTNERYEECPGKSCQAEHCSQLGFPVPCPAADDSCPTKPACVCVDGYVRHDNGTCIPSRECPACGGDPNQVAGCGVYCNRRCRDVGKKPGGCILICYGNACDCRKGLYLDENTGKCVPPKYCTPQCPLNEVYDTCIQGNCGPKNCTQLGYPIPCPKIDPKYCKKGCLCKPGYVRNHEGTCIPSIDCPSCGGDPNAQSGCGTNCNKHCSDIGKEPGACILSCNLNGCDCKDGYYLDEPTNKCVKPEECKQCNGPNEEYNKCSWDCPPQTCDSIDKVYACPAQSSENCKPMCRCKSGYYRNKIGQCISEEQCRRCSGPHEYYSCGGACDNVCETLHEQSQDNCPIINVKCNEMCYCEKGYARAENNTCIPISSCNGPRCPINERYERCPGKSCKPQHCSQLGFPIPCPADDASCPKKSACVCVDGYVRDNNGKCIPIEECPPVCLDKNNEVYSDCINGGCSRKNCSQYGKEVPCIKIDPKYCIKGCLCKDGYLRASNGKCIPENTCPEACNGQNEEYVECTYDCPPRTCESLDKSYACPIRKGEECRSMCRCKQGYYRNSVGLCITEKQCRMCVGPHEYYACGGACDNVCNTIKKQNQTHCPIVNIKCNEKCYCEKGYARNSNNTCIPISRCNDPVCLDKNNEVYSDCINGGCSRKNCSQYGKEVPCIKIDPKYCIKGCLCKDGYLRASNGKCIPENTCPEACNGQNEEYVECTYDCPPRTCDSLDKSYACPIREGEECRSMCRCKQGYYRNSVGLCITEKQCRMCVGPHEYYACGGACDNVCNTIKKQNQTHCPIVNIKCNEKCYCEEGYARNSNNTCIPISRCNDPVCLDKNNEVYSDCINGGCSRKNCSQYGKEVPCIKIDPKYCIKGCLCKDGYLRASNGKCIPENTCPEACNGQNEEYVECTYDCPPRTCDSLDRSYACPIREGEDCRSMCRCKQGYYRNSVGLCITEKQCRMCVGPHEYYACSGACDNVCKTIKTQNQTHCPIVNIKCNEMCYCEEGYARSKNNTCIPISSCNEPQCPINERYEKCPAAFCEPKQCSQLGYPIPCPVQPLKKQCPTKPGCICNDGYVRNDHGQCIPKNECPSCGGDPNAVSSCGVNCGKNCKDLGKEGVACIDICYVNGCDCKVGYYFDSKQKKCVLPGQCTDICGSNEVYEDCSNPICRVKNCTQLGYPLDCDSKCLKGCVCEDGYARDSKGRCIPIKRCPSCGGDPNAESGCGVNCLKKCYDLDNPDRPKICPRICKVNACDCKKGYYLDESINKCVLPGDCSLTCGVNEINSSCVNGGCEMKNCSQLGEPQICIDPLKCLEGCICKEGYLRLKNGTCVPIDQCPTPTCKKNERFSLCPPKECQPQSCKDIGFPIDCVDQKGDCPGHPACICDFGYVRNNKGICRPKSECPFCGGDPNAQPGCGINCGKRCPNNNLNPKLCPRICLPNACDCKENYYYDINVKQCVKHEDCSPRCDELNNEEYDSCVNGGCGWKNCSQVGGPVICIRPKKCEKGCSCKEGYYKLNNGTCVPENQCPLNCRNPNEEYVSCPPKCPPQTCESIGHKFCPRQVASDCKGQCRCKKNFYRNKIGECISARDCLKCNGTHEYFSCGPECDNVCSKLDTESKNNCPIVNVKCNPKCYCEDGYARNHRGICIPIDKCPGRQTTTTAKCKSTTTPPCTASGN